MRVEFPYPPRKLSPNARVHHMARYRLASKFKDQCFWIMALTPGFGAFRARLTKFDGLIPIIMTIYRPSPKSDDDNIEAAFKAGRDGIAAALGVDDGRFRVTRVISPETKKGGLIVLEFNLG